MASSREVVSQRLLNFLHLLLLGGIKRILVLGWKNGDPWSGVWESDSEDFQPTKKKAKINTEEAYNESLWSSHYFQSAGSYPRVLYQKIPRKINDTYAHKTFVDWLKSSCPEYPYLLTLQHFWIKMALSFHHSSKEKRWQ